MDVTGLIPVVTHAHHLLLAQGSGSGSGSGTGSGSGSGTGGSSIQLPTLPTVATGSGLASNGVVQLMLQLSGYALSLFAVFVAIKAMFALMHAVNRGLGNEKSGGVSGVFMPDGTAAGMPSALREIIEIGIALMIVALVISGEWTTFLTALLNVLSNVINSIVHSLPGASGGASG